MAGAVTADEWHRALYPASPLPGAADGAPLVRHFAGTVPEVDQPALLDDVICLHLGGAKRVVREQGSHVTTHDVPLGALTVMPRLQRNRWRAIGPVDFIHIALKPGLISQVLAEEFEEDPATVALHDAVGFRDPLLEVLGRGLADTIEHPVGRGRLYVESLQLAFAMALLATRSSLAPRTGRRPTFKGGLPAWRFKRVAEHVETFLHEDIRLDTLARLSNLSRAQFFRAFRQSTGMTPGGYVRHRRVERAKRLIEEGELRLPEIALTTGFCSRDALTAAFRSETGMCPSEYRSRMR